MPEATSASQLLARVEGAVTDLAALARLRAEVVGDTALSNDDRAELLGRCEFYLWETAAGTRPRGAGRQPLRGN